MNAPWVVAFTVIDMDDWSLLFEGQNLVLQGHSIRLCDLVEPADGRPFTLTLVTGDGSALHVIAEEGGEIPADMTLFHALKLAERKP